MPVPKAPSGLKPGGRRLWRSVADEYELAEHERVVLLEAFRTVDSCDALQALVDDDGVLNSGPQGVRAHPALVELRQQRVTLAKLVASLRIPLDDDQSAGRLPQQRVGVRRPSLRVTA